MVKENTEDIVIQTGTFQVRKKEGKRKARENVILDYDDLFIMFVLIKNNECPISKIKFLLNSSHNSLKIHLTRLENLGILKVSRGKENYKIKFASLTKEGKELWLKLFNLDGLKEYIQKNFLQIKIKKGLLKKGQKVNTPKEIEDGLGKG